MENINQTEREILAAIAKNKAEAKKEEERIAQVREAANKLKGKNITSEPRKQVENRILNTRERTEKDLRERGFSEEEIKKIDNIEAWKILNNISKKESELIQPKERKNNTYKINLLDKNDPNRKGAPSAVTKMAKNAAANFTGSVNTLTTEVAKKVVSFKEKRETKKKQGREKKIKDLWVKYEKEAEEKARKEKMQNVPKFNLLDKNDPNRKGAPGAIKKSVKNAAKNFTAPIRAFTRGVADTKSKLTNGINNWKEGRKAKRERRIAEKAQAEKEIENFSTEEKEQIGLGFTTIGFKVEKWKNDIFAKAFDVIINDHEIKGYKIKGTGDTGRGKFYKELRDSFVRDAEEARKKGVAVQEGKDVANVKNIGLLVGNALKYGRIVADVTGASIANPLRWAMLGAMGVARGAEAGKEARLKNEDVIEKTRIQDTERAADEAWNIYERAYQEKMNTQALPGSVSAEDLKRAYLMEMPNDLYNRLGDPETTKGFLQVFMQGQIAISLARLNNKRESLYNNKKLSNEEYKKALEKLMKNWQKDLNDYDRILTQHGTVDELAMGIRYLQKLGKGAVVAMQIETAVVSVEKLFGKLADILSSHDIHPGDWLSEHLRNPFGGGSKTETNNAVAPESHSTTLQHTNTLNSQQAAEKQHRIELNRKNDTALKKLHHGEVKEPEAPVPPATTALESIKINPRALIGHNEGIEHAFRRQIEDKIKADPEWAKSLGYKGDVTDLKALHKFSGGEADRLAIKFGYVDGKTGTEIRIKGPDNEIAYQLKMDSGEIKVDELRVHGGFVEGHAKGSELEKDIEKNYEYKYTQPKRPVYHAAEKISETSKPNIDTVKAPAPLETPIHSTETSELHTDTHTEATPTPEEIARARVLKNIEEAQKPSINHREPRVPYEPYRPPSAGEQGYWTNQHAAATYKPYNQPYGNSYGIREHFFNDLSPAQNDAVNHILRSHPEFANYNLSGHQIMDSYYASEHGIEYIMRDQVDAWGNMSDVKASDILKHTELLNVNSVNGRLVNYLTMLKNMSNIKPQTGWFGRWGGENVKEYMARALEKLADEEKLEEFQNLVNK